MSEIVIKEKNDEITYEQIQELLFEAHKSNERMNLRYATAHQSVERLISKIGSNGICLVAICDDCLAGTATVSFCDLDYWYYSGRVAIIKLVGVSPKHKGKHIASELIHECIERAKANNIHVIVSDSAEQNVIMKKLFYKYGFLRVDYCKYQANNFYSAVYAKWLSKKAYPKWYCAIRFFLKKAVVHIRYRRDTGKK